MHVATFFHSLCIIWQLAWSDEVCQVPSGFPLWYRFIISYLLIGSFQPEMKAELCWKIMPQMLKNITFMSFLCCQKKKKKNFAGVAYAPGPHWIALSSLCLAICILQTGNLNEIRRKWYIMIWMSWSVVDDCFIITNFRCIISRENMATAFVSLLLCSKVILDIFPAAHGSTHWMVTEDGRIQAQVLISSIHDQQKLYN